MNEEQARTPVYLRCARDDHQWIAAWLPMAMDAYLRTLTASRCPVCRKRDQLYMSYEPQAPATEEVRSE